MSILGLIGGVASQIFNVGEQRRVNKQQERFSREMANQQWDREQQAWHMQNEYNDPKAQMQRLENAGLNPNLVYGNGATTQSANLSPKSAHGSSPSASKLDLFSLAQQQLMLQSMQSQIDKTKAETEAVKASTVGREFENQVKQAVGYEQYASKERHAIQQLQTTSNRALYEYEAWKSAAFNDIQNMDAKHYISDNLTISQNSPLVLALKAGMKNTIIDAENAVRLGNLRDAEQAIKQFEVNMVKNGLPANSPWYVKFMTDVINKIFKTSAGSFIHSGMDDKPF